MTEPIAPTTTEPTEDLAPEQFAEMAQRIEAGVGTFIVGQQQLVRQTVISLLAGSPRAARRRARPRQDDARPHARRGAGPRVQPHPVHAGPDAGRHHRHEHHRRDDGRRAALRVPAGADLRQPRPRRRDQPRHAEDPDRAARSDAGASRHRRQAAVHAVDEPFFVLATQNPIEMEGTYPLPEAQLDRFFFKIDVPFPTEDELIAIIERTTGVDQPTVGKAATARRRARDAAPRPRRARSPRTCMDYAVRVLRATHPDDGTRPRDREALRPLRRHPARCPGDGAGRRRSTRCSTDASTSPTTTCRRSPRRRCAIASS